MMLALADLAVTPYKSLENSLRELTPPHQDRLHGKTLCVKKASDEFSLCDTSFKQKMINLFHDRTTNPQYVTLAINKLIAEVKLQDPHAVIDTTLVNVEMAKAVLSTLCKKAHRMPSNYQLAFPQKIADRTGENWLKETLERHPSFNQKLLNEIVLPASHDSGASFVSFPLVTKSSGILSVPITTFDKKMGDGFFNIEGIVDDLTVTQKSITAQLHIGARDLDFRIFQPLIDAQLGPFYLGHTFCTIPLAQAIKEMNDFLEAHPEEILRIFVDNDDYDIKAIADFMTSEQTGIKGIHSHQGDSAYHLTIREMIDKDQRVILCFQNKAGSPIAERSDIWDGSSDYYTAPYIDTSTSSKKLDCLRRGIYDFTDSLEAGKLKKTQKLLQLEFTLTPQVTDGIFTVFRRALGLQPLNIERLTGKIQKKMEKFFRKNLRFDLVGSVGTDFISKGLVDQVNKLNAKRAEETVI